MLIIGIDPGTRHLGWGVVRSEGGRPAHVAHGVIDTDLDGSLADRLIDIDRELSAVLELHRPTAAAVETLFFGKNAQSAAKLGHARGVVLLLMARGRIPVSEYTPARVKRTVSGHGASDKAQVTAMMMAVFRLTEPPRADAADALAVALTHCQCAPFEASLAAQGLAGLKVPPRRRGPTTRNWRT